MEFKESLKILRSEIGMTQLELAAALHITKKTVSRWEVGESIPHMRTMQEIFAIAKQKGASERCIKNLQSALPAERVKVLHVPKSKLYPVDKESICDLVDDSHTAILVRSMETDELLYANKKAKEYLGGNCKPGEKCYHYIYGRNIPCLHCIKDDMLEDESSTYLYVSPKDGRHFLLRGRKLLWNGQPAHAQYFFEETKASESQEAYQKLVNQLDVGVCIYWVHDDGHIEMNFVSDGYFTVVGSTREKRMQGAGFGAMNDVCEEDRQRVDDLVLAASKARQPIRVVYKVQLDDGSMKELYERARFIKRENGKSLYYCTVEESDRGLQTQERGDRK